MANINQQNYKFFIIFGSIALCIAIGIIAFTELATSPSTSNQLVSTSATSKKIPEQTLSHIKTASKAHQPQPGSTISKEQQKNESLEKKPIIVFDYDISQDISTMNKEEIEDQVKDLEKLVADYQLINRLNDNLATKEEIEASNKLFARLSNLRMAEVDYLLVDLQDKFDRYEEKHKDRLEKYRKQKEELTKYPDDDDDLL